MFGDSGAENTDNKGLETQDVQDEGKEDSDTDASENIEEHEEDSCSEQNDTDSSADECDEERPEQYVALRKYKNKVTDSYYWEKTPFSTQRKRTKNNMLVKLPKIINDLLELWHCLFDNNILDMTETYTNQYIDIM